VKRLPTFLLLVTGLFGLAALCDASEKPNVILFLADDLGYRDLGCYGHPIIQMPNIDALARQGVRLTDCHSAGTVCSPSRASLLTGRTPYRVGFYTITGQARPLNHDGVTNRKFRVFVNLERLS